jgi:hypothetical protein
MIIKYNEHILDYLIKKSFERNAKYPNAFPMDSEENRIIYDELDSLTMEELMPIHAIFLLGSESNLTIEGALEDARRSGFKAVESMAFNPHLDKILSRGKDRLKHNFRPRMVK